MVALGIAAASAPSAAQALRENTQTALERLEDTLSLRWERGELKRDAIVPVMVVSLSPMFAESEADFSAAALGLLQRAFGGGSLRYCAACRLPRTNIDAHGLTLSFGAADIGEIIRLDGVMRGAAAAARSALWLDETSDGVSLRLVDVSNGAVLWVENIDPNMTEAARTARHFSQTQELHRRLDGNSLTTAFVDLGIYPGQHFSMEWVDQWGERNTHLSGFALSGWDPLLGVGGVYHEVLPELFNISVGLKVLLSIPTTLVQQVLNNDDTNLTDRLLTAVLIARWPVTDNFGVIITASTNLRFALGISLLNTTLLPVLP